MERKRASLNVMRYTVVDERGAISFVADCNLLPLLVSACPTSDGSIGSLLAATGTQGARLRDYVESGLAVFDEHNVPENYVAIHGAIKHMRGHEVPVFRVVDDATRQISLQPVEAGIVVFNLKSRRIVQIQNTFAEIRTMVERVRRLERAGWRIVP